MKLTRFQSEAALHIQSVTGCTNAQAVNAVKELVNHGMIGTVRNAPTSDLVRPNVKDNVDEGRWLSMYPEITSIFRHICCSVSTAANVCYEMHRDGYLLRGAGYRTKPIDVGDVVIYEEWCGPQKVVSIQYNNDPNHTKSAVHSGDILFATVTPVDDNSKSIGHDVWLEDLDLLES